MKSFIKPIKNYDYENDIFYNEINNIIGFKKTTICGSYIKYGKDKACDMDLTEEINYLDLNEYINKIYNNKNKFYTIQIYFDIPYLKLLLIKNKLGYINGNMKKIQNESILEDVNNLPEILKNDLLLLINNYKNTQDINDFIKIKLYVNKHIYTNWTYAELLKRNKNYYDENIIINNNFTFLYIEKIYKNIRISNFIRFKIDELVKDYIIFEIEDLVFNDNIFYYKLLKKLLVFIKWLFITKKIKEYELQNSVIDIYNDIYQFIDNIGNNYNKTCINNNYIDIYYYKINKYNNKNINSIDNKKKIIYNKLLYKYNKKIKYLKNIYNNDMNNINEISKSKYLPISIKFEKYLEIYYKIL